MKLSKVLIVDKDILARQVIVNILRDYSNHQTIGTGSELEETIKKISLIEPDVALLNLESENPNISTIFRDLKEQFPSLPVIVLPPPEPRREPGWPLRL